MKIETIADLEALYGVPPEGAILKVTDHLTSGYRALVEAAPLVALATGGADGFDCSPRGDPGQVAFVRDPRTLVIPDRRGNNRLDTLRNIVADGRIAALFLVPGCNETLRVNGRAHLSTEPELLDAHVMQNKRPVCCIVIEVAQVYFQCCKALVRSDLWNARVDRASLPTAGELLRGAHAPFPAEEYDAAYPARLKKTLY